MTVHVTIMGIKSVLSQATPWGVPSSFAACGEGLISYHDGHLEIPYDALMALLGITPYYKNIVYGCYIDRYKNLYIDRYKNLCPICRTIVDAAIEGINLLPQYNQGMYGNESTQKSTP